MASPPTSVLIGLLKPWLQCARDRMTLSVDTFATSTELARSVWLQWNLPEDGAITIEDVEALELLELLVCVDFHAGWKALLEITGNGAHLDHVMDAATLSRSPLLPQFEIVGLHHAFTHSSLEKVLQWLLFAVNPRQHSPSYYTVRQALLQCCADRHYQGGIAPVTREAEDRIRLKFDLNLKELDHKSAEKLLKKVVEVATLLKHPEQLKPATLWQRWLGRSISALSDVFSLDAVNVTFDRTLTSTCVLGLTQHLCDRLDINVEAFDLGSAMHELPAETMVPFFRSMLAPETTSENKTPQEIAMGYYTGAGYWQFYAATSALQISSSVSKMSFKGPNDLDAAVSNEDVRRWWAWAAYQLFSAEASPTVNAVHLDADFLYLEHVLAFEQVLEMRDPLVYIASCLGGSFELRAPELATQAPTVVEVFPCATLLVGPERVEICTKDEVETLRVVDNSPDKQHVRVVYPGAGVCWLHRSQVIRHREFSVPSVSAGGVDSIFLEITNTTDLVAAIRLLKCIGRSLRRLKMRGLLAFLDDSFFMQVFAACPLLQRLDLVTLNIASLEWLGTCGSRLQSLSLCDVWPRQPDSYNRMLTTISAATGKLVDLHIQPPADQLQSLIVEIEKMLGLNSVIERMFLSVRKDEPVSALVKTLNERLSKHSGKLLGVQRAPLPLRRKLAFLSALAQGRATEASTKLPTELITTIFEFGAQCKQRVCGCVQSIMDD